MSAAGHDHVHIHFGARVFFIGEIQQGAVVHDADACALLRCAWTHSIFTGDPALAAAFQKTRHAIIYRGRADHPGVSQLDKYAAFGRGDKIGRNFQGTHLLRGSAVSSHSSSFWHHFRPREFYGLRSVCASLPGVLSGGNAAEAGAGDAGLLLTTNVPVKSRCPASVSTSCP